jgi:hypothetical protein
LNEVIPIHNVLSRRQCKHRRTRETRTRRGAGEAGMWRLGREKTCCSGRTSSRQGCGDPNAKRRDVAGGPDRRRGAGPAGPEFGVAEGSRAIANPGAGWGVHFRRTQETAIGAYIAQGEIFKPDLHIISCLTFYEITSNKSIYQDFRLR